MIRKNNEAFLLIGMVGWILMVQMPCHAQWSFWYAEESTGVSLPFHEEAGDSWCGSECYGDGSRNADSTGVSVSFYSWSKMWVNLETSSSDSENPPTLWTTIWGKSHYINLDEPDWIIYETTIDADGCVEVGGQAYDWYCYDNNDISARSAAQVDVDILNTGQTSDNGAWANGWADSDRRDVGSARYAVEGNATGANGVDTDGGTYYAYTDFSIDFTPPPYPYYGNGIRTAGGRVQTAVDTSASAWCDDPNDIVAVYGCTAYAEVDADIGVDVTLNVEP